MTVDSVSSNNRSLLYALLYCGALYGWMQWGFLHPLTAEANDMHQKQLDPTDIVKTPYDLIRLATYVTVVASVVLCLPNHTSTSWMQRVVDLTSWSVALLGVFLLCGAPLMQDLGQTGLAALYMCTLFFHEPPLFTSIQNSRSLQYRFIRPPPGPTTAARKIQEGSSTQLLPPLSASQLQDGLAGAVATGVLVVVIPIQILRLYDRGYQVQRWPVPVVLGSTIGYILGTFIYCAWVLVGTWWGRKRTTRTSPPP